MIENNLIKSASFLPKSLESPNYWVGHLPFANFVTQEIKPKIFVELGTHSGNSYFSFCQAVLEGELSTKCYAIDTWQGDEHVGQYGDEVFDAVNSHNLANYSHFSQLLRMTFDDALNHFADESIDLLHIDGLHIYEAVRHDFETWLPKMAPGGVIMFHDTNIREHNFGVWKLWAELQSNYPNNLEFFHSCGLGVLQLNNPPFTKKISWLAENFLEKKTMLDYFSALGTRQAERYMLRELESKIQELNHNIQADEIYLSIIDRDEQIENLSKAVSERDEQIKLLQHMDNDRQAFIIELRNEIDAYRSSTSWRITRPMRELPLMKQRLIRLMQFYQNYRHKYPGTSGYTRLIDRCIDALRKGGFKELRNTICLHEKIGATADLEKYTSTHNVTILNDIVLPNLNLPTDVAVHAHIYYPDLAGEIRSYLKNMPVKFHFYVTTDTLEKAELIKDAFANMETILILDIVISENRGRDIFPMLVTLGNKLTQHEIVLHIHTKRSPHNAWVFGGWRRYMMESLLGNSQRISAILQQFVQNKRLGILFPEPYYTVKPLIHKPSHANDSNMEKLVRLAGKDIRELNTLNRTFFPAGDMFWFRGKAIQSFIEMNLTVNDFEPEEGQLDGTLAHAIERLFPFFAYKANLNSQAYLSSSFLSTKCSAHQFKLFHDYLGNGLIDNAILLFDHNIGGGANTYTRELVKTALDDGSSILRVYNLEGIWFLQWHANGDGMLFYTSAIDELFNGLSISHSTRIIVNSLYGHPDINSSASNIIDLTRKLGATLDIKLHDFNAICPSPHLLDFEGKYCGVPQDPNSCAKCLSKNQGWYHSWYPEENKSFDIIEWRKPFAALITAADTLTAFDPSSIEIVRQAFDVKSCKINIIPHATSYFKCEKPVDLRGKLHIGILGTMTKAKGSDVVKALHQHIKTQYIRVPITLVGSSVVEIPQGIMIHGKYETNDLPKIVNKQGINVILMPSIIPETFSYTISEAMEMGLPIVAFDIGAQGNRVKQYKLGKVIPPNSSPKVILAAIQSILKFAQEQTI